MLDAPVKKVPQDKAKDAPKHTFFPLSAQRPRQNGNYSEKGFR